MTLHPPTLLFPQPFVLISHHLFTCLLVREKINTTTGARTLSDSCQQSCLTSLQRVGAWLETCFMNSQNVFHVPFSLCAPRALAEGPSTPWQPQAKPQYLSSLPGFRPTLEFEVDSRKQSLLPNPSAARHSFCCSLWMVAVHCRTTSSSCRKRKRRKRKWDLTRWDSLTQM